jgi:hypothetical protein
MDADSRPCGFRRQLMEMFRRVLLVGVLVIFPFPQGSVMQVATANVVCTIFLVLQLQAMPFRTLHSNYLACGCNLSLSVMFLCTIFYKYSSGLTELPNIDARMSTEQRDDFRLANFALELTFFVAVFGALLGSAFLLTVQLAKEEAARAREERAGKARRLRWLANGHEVVLGEPVVFGTLVDESRSATSVARPSAVALQYHLFLSHVWSTGQDQMRIVKTRLHEMLPDARVFLGTL